MINRGVPVHFPRPLHHLGQSSDEGESSGNQSAQVGGISYFDTLRIVVYILVPPQLPIIPNNPLGYFTLI